MSCNRIWDIETLQCQKRVQISGHGEFVSGSTLTLVVL